MSQEQLDLRGTLKVIRRHRTAVGVTAGIGLLAGVALTLLSPPQLSGTAEVLLGSATHDTATQLILAASDPVLGGAQSSVRPALSITALRASIAVRNPAPNIIAITASGKTAAAADGIANAVARSYVSYLTGGQSKAVGVVQAQLIQPATQASGTSLPVALAIKGLFGLIVGGLIGAIGALGYSRRDRRLRERDEIAGAIGVPVLASIPVDHPKDAGRWTRLLEEYQPGAVHDWQLRGALRYLGQPDTAPGPEANGDTTSVTVLTLSSDRDALALGPQLAVFAASLGISTALVIGPEQDTATEALRTACAAPGSARRPGTLQVIVADAGAPARAVTRLTVVVTVVDTKEPRLGEAIRTTATVLGVSAGATTAAQLASVAVTAAADGRQIDGILVADPERADRTTGRVPQLARASHRRTPTRLTGSITEARQ